MGENNVIEGMVSTIIPVYNRPAMVVRAVESVLDQNYRPIEILVVDDGSTDETPDVLERLRQQYAEVRVFRQDNAGPGVAREFGRRHIQGEYVQYLDSDDRLLPNKFINQVALLKAEPGASVAYGKTARFSRDNRTIDLQAIKRTGEKMDYMFPAFLRSRMWDTSTPLYRRSIVDKAGPWLPLINEEDWEYDCRVASLGTALVYVDEFVSMQHRHDDHLSSDGTIDQVKLEHRCVARAAMYQSARRFNSHAAAGSLISIDDFGHFSKSVFLLARQCAAQGMAKQAAEMFLLSIEINQGKTVKHILFNGLVQLFGWRNSARLITMLGR